MINFHRKEQFDIIEGGIKKPLLVIAWTTPGSYSRLFCLWRGGVWVRGRGKKRYCWQWGGTTPRAADVLTCPQCKGKLHNGYCEKCKAAFEIARG